MYSSSSSLSIVRGYQVLCNWSATVSLSLSENFHNTDCHIQRLSHTSIGTAITSSFLHFGYIITGMEGVMAFSMMI